VSLSLVTAPESEPIDVAETKAHLEVVIDDDDDLIAEWIVAAREYGETFTHRAFLTQTWDWTLDAFPCRAVLEIPLAPLQITTAPVITYVDTAGVTQTWSASLYTVDAPAGPKAMPGRIVPIYGGYFPPTRSVPNAVTVRFVCGYGGPEDVPSLIKVALKEHVRAAMLRGDAAEAQKVLQWVREQLWSYKAFYYAGEGV
jgi:uncharacterized phiE125 gp8 family phage protein